MSQPLTHYRSGSDLERRLESIALVSMKQRALGEKPDLKFSAVARSFGIEDRAAIVKIQQRVAKRWETIRGLSSPCIFAEAERRKS